MNDDEVQTLVQLARLAAQLYDETVTLREEKHHAQHLASEYERRGVHMQNQRDDAVQGCADRDAELRTLRAELKAVRDKLDLAEALIAKR